MRIAVVAYPNLEERDREWIESFRASHDPQSPRLPVHFTLVFPAETTPRTLELELRIVADLTTYISFVVRRAEVTRGALDTGVHVCLLPDEGSPEIATLHSRLYANSLRSFLRADVPFVPHMTVAAAPDMPAGERLAKALGLGARVVQGTITSIDLVDVEPRAVRTLSNYRLRPS
jgi:2'-5' RNA ligase